MHVRLWRKRVAEGAVDQMDVYRRRLGDVCRMYGIRRVRQTLKPDSANAGPRVYATTLRLVLGRECVDVSAEGDGVEASLDAAVETARVLREERGFPATVRRGRRARGWGSTSS